MYTVYLQQLRDSSLVALDSMVINGEGAFALHSDLEEPEVLLLMLAFAGNKASFFVYASLIILFL